MASLWEAKGHLALISALKAQDNDNGNIGFQGYGIRQSDTKALKVTEQSDEEEGMNNASINSEKGYSLRENRKKSRRASGSKHNVKVKKNLNVCKECSKGFPSMRALSAHIRSHSKRNRVSIESAESGYEPPLAIRKKRWRTRNKFSSNPSPSSSSSSVIQERNDEVEDVYTSLMHLYRCARNWDFSHSVDNGELGAAKSSLKMICYSDNEEKGEDVSNSSLNINSFHKNLYKSILDYFVEDNYRAMASSYHREYSTSHPLIVFMNQHNGPAPATEEEVEEQLAWLREQEKLVEEERQRRAAREMQLKTLEREILLLDENERQRRFEAERTARETERMHRHDIRERDRVESLRRLEEDRVRQERLNENEQERLKSLEDQAVADIEREARLTKVEVEKQNRVARERENHAMVQREVENRLATELSDRVIAFHRENYDRLWRVRRRGADGGAVGGARATNGASTSSGAAGAAGQAGSNDGTGGAEHGARAVREQPMMELVGKSPVLGQPKRLVSGCRFKEEIES